MNEPQADNPFESPETSEAMVTASPVETAKPADPLAAELANLPSRWARLGAAVIDFFLVDGAAMFVGPFVAPVLTSLLTIRDANGEGAILLDDDLPLVLTGVLTTLFFYLLFQSYLLASRGQTIGKALLHMKTVCRNGQPAGYLRLVFVRYFPWLVIWYAQLFLIDIDPVGPLMLVRLFCSLIPLADPLPIFWKERRCLHDYIAGTIVVRALDNERS